MRRKQVKTLQLLKRVVHSKFFSRFRSSQAKVDVLGALAVENLIISRSNKAIYFTQTLVLLSTNHNESEDVEEGLLSEDTKR